jgi:iron(III) transport system substrate-binding protein
MKRAAAIVLLLALLAGLPIVFRRQSTDVSAASADDRLVVISPHNETIRREFGRAFGAWWRAKTGRRLYVDWRTPGGTSEIRLVLDASFKAAKETGREGVDIDVFFGGGEPDFASQAKQGRLARAEVFDRHPDWFGENAVIPPMLTGERLWATDGTWVGCSLSQFGIAYNPDVLARFGVSAPRRWDDLGDPKLRGTIALADPTKSGSVARAFELLVQSHMQRAMAESGADPTKAAALGWERGFQLILRMSANARYFTDSASKIPHDIGQGDSAAGMCIDFYGRAYRESLLRANGSSRVEWIAPEAGGSFSADPVAVLKGAPHPKIAQAFVEFCLSPEGQTLWFAKPGTPGGPGERALHRTPIRRDVYTAENVARSTIPEVNPYASEAGFVYRKELTGRAFNTLRQLVKVACIDSHDELKRAWRALADAGFPPDATAVLLDVSAVPYEAFGQGDAVLDGNDLVAAAKRASELGEGFRANFRRAEVMAKRSQANPSR